MDRLNLDWVADDLAVGGAVPMPSYAWLAKDHGLSAVIDMRSEACDDADALAQLGIAHLNLPVEDHAAPRVRHFDAAVTFAERCAARGGKLFIHCQEGVGRAPITALAVLAARGEDPMAALERAKARRWQVSPNPVQYEAWRAWLQERVPRAAVPPFERFAAVAYRHLAPA